VSDARIEPIRVSEHITWFYWGRYPDHENMDMRLGGGAHAIHHGSAALLVDTMNLPGQGAWVRRYLHETLGIRDLQVVNTHWHPDHVAENHCFADVPIIGHRHTRALMLEHRAGLEAGLWPGCPPIPVVPPTLTFEGRKDLRVGGLAVELHEFAIHERGHIAVYLPCERTLIAGDMLEDPIWIFHLDFAGPERQLAEYERMRALGATRLLATHCTPAHVRRGGYDLRFIENNADYLRGMLADVAEPGFATRQASHYIGRALAAGELEWWGPYAEIHAINRRTLLEHHASLTPSLPTRDAGCR
jgi:glyoxylase-like metal-dependent hydrolase (beta-lactamase superfamily II)